MYGSACLRPPARVRTAARVCMCSTPVACVFVRPSACERACVRVRVFVRVCVRAYAVCACVCGLCLCARLCVRGCVVRECVCARARACAARRNYFAHEPIELFGAQRRAHRAHRKVCVRNSNLAAPVPVEPVTRTCVCVVCCMYVVYCMLHRCTSRSATRGRRLPEWAGWGEQVCCLRMALWRPSCNIQDKPHDVRHCALCDDACETYTARRAFGGGCGWHCSPSGHRSCARK
jgi:hypothetical protein